MSLDIMQIFKEMPSEIFAACIAEPLHPMTLPFATEVDKAGSDFHNPPCSPPVPLPNKIRIVLYQKCSLPVLMFRKLKE